MRAPALHSTRDTRAQHLIFNALGRSVKANEAAILGYFEPVGAILLALIFFREVPGKIALLGGALILYSGYMILKARLK